MEKNHCPECGEILKGRTDKKFCSDMCRNSFNNKVNSSANNYIRNINNSLRKNRKILALNLHGDKTTIPKQKLLDQGFNFKYYTNRLITKKNDAYTFCYEYGFLPIENDFILIVKKND